MLQYGNCLDLPNCFRMSFEWVWSYDVKLSMADIITLHNSTHSVWLFNLTLAVVDSMSSRVLSHLRHLMVEVLA